MCQAQWPLHRPRIEVGIILKFKPQVALGHPDEGRDCRLYGINAKKEATPRLLPFLINRGY